MTNPLARLTVAQKTVVAVILVLFGMLAMATASITTSRQIEAQQQTLNALLGQRDGLRHFDSLIKRASASLYRVLYAGAEAETASLLATSEDILSVYENFRAEAESLAAIGLPQDYYFAVENESLMLALRNEISQVIAALRQGQRAQAVAKTENVITNRVHQLQTFTENAADLLRFQISDAETELQSIRKRSLRSLLIIFVIIGAFGAIAIWLIGRSVSKPLVELTETARSIGQTDDLGQRAPVRGSDEIGALATEFNKMLEHLEDSAKARDEVLQRLGQSLDQLEEEAHARERLVSELGQKNTELEQFSYTVSHDLKSPLVTVNGFIGLLDMDIKSGDQERINADVAQIKQAIHKMGSLLDDLLELSRIGRIVNPPSQFTLNQLVEEVLDSLAGQVELSDARIEVMADMPGIEADRQRMGEVMLSLIENAIKYSSKDQQPLISISAEEQQDQVICCVSDNGIGIDAEYHDTIFGLFDRLDPSFEGTGVGLALVKRIVEVHKGRVWVESDGDGQGSSFYFSVPQRSQVERSGNHK